MDEVKIAVGEHRDLLDIIDQLRSQGVNHYVDLPEIIVCGDQSSGKSSVLEAISHRQFPSKDGACTRFATELVLRRGPQESTHVSIIPSETRVGDEKETLERWQPSANINVESLGAVTKEAMLAMAGQSKTLEFYDDILRVEITGPSQPHLTMVDLPGLFRGENKKQSEADSDKVRAMVKGYMERPRSIILAVVSAKSEYVLQEVTTMAKAADPEGQRTMGLITKPDTLDVGSETEHYYIHLAQNEEEPLRLGWHVLRNRKFDERAATSTQRDTTEREFFSQGLWNSIEPSHCGVVKLRERLSAVLTRQIISQLPDLVQDVTNRIHDCTDELDQLGPVRETPEDQLEYLLRLSEEYTMLVVQAVDGNHSHRFFGDRNRREQFPRRLRAVLRSRLQDFAEEIRSSGQSRYIADSESETDEKGNREFRDSPSIPRSDYIEYVADRLRHYKGRELPGLFNPLIVGDLFVEQCEPWERITKVLVEDVVEAAHQTTQLIVEEIAARDITEEIKRLIRQGIEDLRVELDVRVNDLLTSAKNAITYSPQLAENVQQMQQTRNKRSFKKLIGKTFGLHRFEGPDSKITLNPIELIDLMEKGFEPNVERFGSGLAVDYMEAYYEVALSRFIDDISALAVEDSLISKLPTLFRSNKVLAMSSEERSRLAGEKADSARERSHLIGKRTVLKAGLQNLKSVLKSKNILDLPEKQARMPARDIQKEPYNWTPQRSGRASTDSIRAVPDLPSSGSGIAVSRSAEQRTPEGGTQTAQDEFWSRVRAPQEKKRMDVESGSVKDFEPGWGQ